MRNFLLIAATLFSVASFAQRPFSGNVSKKSAQKELRMAKESLASFEGKTFVPSNVNVAKSQTNRKVSFPSTIITKQPTGTLLKDMWRTYSGFFLSYGEPSYRTEDGSATDLVKADDGSFYIKNPIGGIATSSWIKGTKGEGDTINVELPQLVLQITEDDSTYNYYACKMQGKKYEDEWGYLKGEYTLDETDQTVKFVYRNDSLIKVDTCLLGLANASGTWVGYGDDKIVFRPNTDVIVTPSDLEGVETYSMTYLNNEGNNDVALVKFKKEGDKIYIGGINSTQPNAWICGTLDGDSVRFTTQYLGADPNYNFHIYFVPVEEYPVYYEEWDYTYYFKRIASEVTFAYDAEAKTLTTSEMFAINGGKEKLYFLEIYQKATFAPFEDVAATPATPEFVDYLAFVDNLGYGAFAFSAAKESVDGNPIDTEKMYYNIYFDNEKLTFTPQDYVNLTESMTDIPYNFTDSYDIQISGNTRTIYFYVTGFDKIGVQMFYTGGGETRSSDIVYYTVNDGIASTVADKDAVKVTYTDMSGRKIQNPVHGLYIKNVTYTDGTVKNTKVIIK